MATPKGTHFVISANFLASGAPAYFRSDGTWTSDLQAAHAACTEGERDALLAAAEREQGRIADAYAFPVRLEGSTIDPLTARESIRAHGPTIPYGIGGDARPSDGKPVAES